MYSPGIEVYLRADTGPAQECRSSYEYHAFGVLRRLIQLSEEPLELSLHCTGSHVQCTVPPTFRDVKPLVDSAVPIRGLLSPELVEQPMGRLSRQSGGSSWPIWLSLVAIAAYTTAAALVGLMRTTSTF